jgi:serine/threonine protein kinase
VARGGIVTIYSVEQDGDVRFLTMERVEGQSLDQVIPRGGLPLGQVLEIGATLADALAASHEKGIIHRDLKPANIMLAGRERRVKVLDFGLAKLREEAASDGETTTAALSGEGRILGTVAYMSPEQTEGKPVDARLDLFSLGIVLYEMASGRSRARRASRCFPPSCATRRSRSPTCAPTCPRNSRESSASVSRRTPRSGIRQRKTSATNCAR